jgi:hypothetical protein
MQYKAAGYDKLSSPSDSLVGSKSYIGLEAMPFEHIISQICFDSLGLISLLVSKLQPDVETDAELIEATAVKDTHSSNLLSMWNLF